MKTGAIILTQSFDLATLILSLIGGLVLGIIIGALIIWFIPFFRTNRAKNKSEKIIRDAEIKAEHIEKNAKIDARSTINELKAAAESEIKVRKEVVAESEKKLDAREAQIDRRDQMILQKEQQLDQKKEEYNNKINSLSKKEDELQLKLDSIISELQKVSNMSLNDARSEIMRRVEEKMTKEIALYMKNAEEEAEEQVENKSKELLSLAISKYSQEVTCERTVSVVALPSDEMKGRIIGREGRNIKSLESLLGVDIIIDDTPEVITLSCFDPIRREIARMTIDALIKDGRIQPGRIEEIHSKCKQELASIIHRCGEQACARLGLPRIHKELIDFIGRLKYRTSYGQNEIGIAHL